MLFFKRSLALGSLVPMCYSMAISMNTETEMQQRLDHGFPPTLHLGSPGLTSKWLEGSDYVQVVEMFINNTHPQNSLTLKDTLKVNVFSSSLDTIFPGTLTRLAPGQTAVIQIGVKNKAGVAPGTACTGTVTATWGSLYGPEQSTSVSLSGLCGIGDYSATANSISHHWNPDWYNEVKFGIFIHWGIYSAPAYGNVGENEFYAEWYWRRMTQPDYKSQIYQYHEQTYGQNFTYDDFIANFTAARFDAKEWLDIIEGSGAQYFVQVTKHHDGFALFNFSTEISKRSSIHLGPKRDFVRELLDTAKKFYPQLRRGTYFSLPEWFHPEYVKYAWPLPPGSGFNGGPPVNPYTGVVEEYTGYVKVDDFIQDVQVPQQNALAYDYETEIMWCDIAGSANDAVHMIAPWLNWARNQGRQVTFNNRCGLGGDFSTPEYETNNEIVPQKWESNRGMDPFSYGYNYATPDAEYLTGNDIVQSLIDMISKNGNFLLDIGPKNDGSIPEIMQKGLADAGVWIKAHSESIFKTRYWNNGPGKGNFRYTTAQDAFYIHVMSKPGNTILVPDAVPYLPGDTVTVLGGEMSGSGVLLTPNANGTRTISLSTDQINADRYVWTFKIAYTSDW